MRYYGISNIDQTPEKDEIKFQDTDRTFNRPSPSSGLYNGQAAQNVTRVSPKIQEMPPAIFPPGSKEIFDPIIYEYPASDPKCNDDFKFCISRHIGNVATVLLCDGFEKIGTLQNVGKNFIILSEEYRHTICPFRAISSLSFDLNQ